MLNVLWLAHTMSCTHESSRMLDCAIQLNWAFAEVTLESLLKKTTHTIREGTAKIKVKVLYCVAKLKYEPPPLQQIHFFTNLGCFITESTANRCQHVRQSVGNDCVTVRMMKQPSIIHYLGLISKKWICWRGARRPILLHSRVHVFLHSVWLLVASADIINNYYHINWK